MAIYHLNISTGSKAAGDSGGIRYDYITRQEEYAKKADQLVYQESGNMPAWATSAKEFWTAADTHERANGRVYKEVEFALPRELSHEQQKELARDFARDLTGRKDLPYTLAIHDENGKNPHAHLVYSERGFDGYERTAATHFKRANSKNPERGGAPKVQDMGGKQWVKDVRKDWEVMANAALERAQTPARIDARSYEDQGIDKTPQVHLGVSASAMERRGVKTERGDMYRERQEMRMLEQNLVRLAAQKQLAQRELHRQAQVKAQAKAQVEAQRQQARQRQVQAESDARQKRVKGWHMVEAQVRQASALGAKLTPMSNGERVVGRVLGEMRDSSDRSKLLYVMQDVHNPKRLVRFEEHQGVHKHPYWKPGEVSCLDATGSKPTITKDVRSPLQYKLDTQRGKQLKVLDVQPGQTYYGKIQRQLYKHKGVQHDVLQSTDNPRCYFVVPSESGVRNSPQWRPGQEVELRLDQKMVPHVSVDERSFAQKFVSQQVVQGAKLATAQPYDKIQGRVVEGHLVSDDGKPIHVLLDSKDPKKLWLFVPQSNVGAHKNWRPGREVRASFSGSGGCTVLDVEKMNQQKQERELKRQQDRDRGPER